MVIYSLACGGAERVVSRLSNELSKYHDVDIIIFDNKVSYECSARIISLNLPANKDISRKIITFILRIIKLKKIFKQQQYDQVFSFMETANFPVLVSCSDAIVSVRNNPRLFSKIIQIGMSYLYPIAKKVVCVSKEVESYLTNELRVHNTVTIYNPLNQFFSNELPILVHSRKFILAVGRLDEQKGFEKLIRAYSDSNLSQNYDLLICGEGELRNYLEKLIQTLNLEKHIFLKGEARKIDDYYRSASIFVLSSLYEGFPNVLVEAMGHGLPVISTRCKTGPEEIIIDGKNGLLTVDEQGSNLSELMQKLCYDDELKLKLGREAKKIQQTLSIELIVSQWLALMTN
jgi:GalNAc-alpha-(1->4)-GalNAc-alpha-(1->3)-diNAcBac-PP-undecaprenol alpha-1,4-N-acetyl-D-galactosaminyltransferase